MDVGFVLVHSPSVGPATWTPVAEALRAAGADAVVPSLVEVADGAMPCWPRVVELVGAAIDTLPAGQRVLVAGHSNAGLFLPLIVQASPRQVVGCLFVDAPLPAQAAVTPVADAEMLAFLRGKAIGDRLPPWTDWWDDADIAPLFPDPATRAVVSAEQPRLPLAYYQQQVPVPAGWDRHPCGYLLFGPPYDQEARAAGERGWSVGELPGQHLHQIVAPQAVAGYLLATARRWAAGEG